MKHRNTQSRFVRFVKKFLLSAFLFASFGAYALEHGAQAGGAAEPSTMARIPPPGAPASDTRVTPSESPATATAAPAAAPAATRAPTAEPAATLGPPAPASNGLRDGTYTGPPVDVQWGLVQVQATIKGGQITDVRVLQAPSDRRTSQRINAQADPWLQQEAIQAQSANVDLISGATLTSEGFAMSLQAALDRAHS